MKKLFGGTSVDLLGHNGELLGTVVKTKHTKRSETVSAYLISRLRNLSTTTINAQPILNRLVLLSLATDGSQDLLDLSAVDRLDRYLIAIQKRITFHDLQLCAALLGGKSLIASGEHFYVETIINVP